MNAIKTTLAALITGACAMGAQAQVAGGNLYYLSGSVGSSRADIDCAGTSSCDNSSTAGKILFGYKPSPALGLEVSVASMGKATATVVVNKVPVGLSFKATSIGLGVAGFVPFGASGFTGIGRVGIASNHAKLSGSALGTTASDSESHAEGYYGLGVNYAVSTGFDVGVAWDGTRFRYQGESSRVNAYSIVGSLKF